jgi:hypothetical protein
VARFVFSMVGWEWGFSKQLSVFPTSARSSMAFLARAMSTARMRAPSWP